MAKRGGKPRRHGWNSAEQRAGYLEATGRIRRLFEPETRVSYQRCTILTSEPMTCPLCRGQVTPMQLHECSRPKADGAREE